MELEHILIILLILFILYCLKKDDEIEPYRN